MIKKIASLDVKDIWHALERRDHFSLSEDNMLPASVADFRKTNVYSLSERALIYVCEQQTLHSYELRLLLRNFAHFTFGQQGRLFFGPSGDVIKHRFPVVGVCINRKLPTQAIYRRDVSLKLVGIIVEPTELIDIYGLEIDHLPSYLRQAFEPEGDPQINIQLALSAHCWSTLDAIHRCDFEDPLRTIFIRAKGLELVCAIVSHLNSLSGKRPDSTVRARVLRDRELIKAAAHLYQENVGSFLSIEEVAHRVGLNRNKLNRGFNALFGVSPGEYARRQRLIWAQMQVRTGLCSLKEIAAMAGYANASAFSRAYSELFGRPPSYDLDSSDD